MGRMKRKLIVEKIKYINFIKCLILREMPKLLKLTEDIYLMLAPYFKPKEPKLVKFEIINYLLFRLFYDEIIEVIQDMPLDYFNILPEIFSSFISDPQSWFIQNEILKRNRIYVHVHYFVKYKERGEYSNLSIILFTLIQHISTKKDENNLNFPEFIFHEDPTFPENPGKDLNMKLETLILKAFEISEDPFNINLN
jgi:hypothetical protein